MRLSFLLQIVLICGVSVYAQSSAPPQTTPAQTTPTPAGTPPIAYESAILPKDRVQAWSMLRAGSGLGDDTLQPWVLHAHYKTYDAYGKPKGTGTLEYVRVGPQKSFSTFIEGETALSRWEAKDGFYTKTGELGTPRYPSSLILKEFLHPLDTSDVDAAAPHSYTAENFGGVSVSCFADQSLEQNGVTKRSDLRRACTVLDRPLLLFRGGNYNVFFQRPLAFQHKVTAHKILIRDGTDPVVDVEVDILRTATSDELRAAEPPPDATLHPASAGPVPMSVTAGHNVKKVPPLYPDDAKRRRVEGTVRLSAIIDTEGHVRNLEVLHSPDPMLTDAAEDAVKHWLYTPYLLNGRPVEVTTQVTINFALAR